MITVVIKKDKTKEPWDSQKIIDAVLKASARVNTTVNQKDLEGICKFTKDNLGVSPSVSLIHSTVIEGLRKYGYDAVADAYQEYRDYKNTYAKAFEKVKNEADAVLLLGDRENANFDSSLVSTKGSLIKGYLTKELYRQFYLSTIEKELTKRGDIYIHDMRDMLMGSLNCCLFDMGNVLKGGFSMSNVDYTEPTSVLSALQVIGDITLVATAQQFGGFTIPSIDKVLLPYCKKTWRRAYQDALTNFPEADHENWGSYADKVLRRELEQGFQSLELKLNTVPCSRGDFAFTTLTFGCWNEAYSLKDIQMLAEVCSQILKTRMNGHGPNRKPVVFPKLVYLYDEYMLERCVEAREVFEEAVECSSKCMYPDFLSLTGDPKENKVAQEYLKYGAVVAPMGKQYCP